MSTGSRTCVTGIVAPAFNVREDVPFSSSRYFSPTADTDCTIALVSAGSGSYFFSSFMSTTAVTRPVAGSWCGLIELTTPTRVPAIRTWLVGCSPEVSGSVTLMLYVGTNGSPLLAL